MKRRRLFPPDDPDKPFIRRWNMLARILLVESSVKFVARSAMDFGDFDDGTSCFPSNERIALETGLSPRTIQFGWAVMRGLGMAKRVARGVPHERLADEYELRIPDSWQSLPIIGPHARKFACLHCGKMFIPQGNCTVNNLKTDDRRSDTVRFNLTRMTFCPAPRRSKGRAGVACVDLWSRARKDAGVAPWGKDPSECWKLFREARGDDW